MRLGTLTRTLLASLALGACVAYVPGPPDTPRMGVRTYFGVEHVCSLGVSPPIRLFGAPESAARYRVRFTNTSVLFTAPMELETPAAGAEIAEGALDGYRGPCVGEASASLFRIEVLALDANGRSLAYGFAIAQVSNPSRLLNRQPTDQTTSPNDPPFRSSR
jgi:hypothetical protein